MKRILLTMAVAVTAMFATAQTKTYTDNLAVDINGEVSEQEATIYVAKNSNGTYCLSLNKFILGGMLPVGNIVLDNITVTEEAGIRGFETRQNILITAGDENTEDWIGPGLGEVPVDLKGKMTDGSLFCTIGIDMSDLLEDIVAVTFGKDIKAARIYTDELFVAINDNPGVSQQTTINVDEKTDGTYTLSLNNFILTNDEDTMPIGNIVIHNITASETNGVSSFAAQRNINIVEGDVEAAFWMGPQLGEVPVDMTGKMTEYKLYCNIDIDMASTIGQTINVKFGNESLTGIADIAGEAGEKVIFDLTGRRVETVTTPGIYIVNGKKAVIR